MTTLDQLYLRYCLASFDRQLYLAAMMGKRRWYFELNLGVVRFDRPHQPPEEFNVQVLGTESDDGHTWLWAWANEASAIPPAFVRVARDMRDFGAREGIGEFTAPQLAINARVNGDRLSAIASGMARAGAYFRAPYPGGAVFMLIKDGRYKRVVSKPLQRVARVAPMFFARDDVGDERTAFAHYARFYRLDTREDERRMVAHDSRPNTFVESQLVATFDAARRLRGIELTAADEPAAGA